MSDVEVGSHQSSHAPMLPDYGLTSLQMVCAREIAKGRKAPDVRRQYGITAKMWREWVADPQFVDAIQKRIIRADQIVEDALRDGEVQAAATLVQALGATTPLKHKDGKVRHHPDWHVRVRAAMSLLDRRGERGKPIERVQSANFNMTPETRHELAQALADPAVRAFLAADPALAEQLRTELKQLGPSTEGPCDSASTTASLPPLSSPPSVGASVSPSGEPPTIPPSSTPKPAPPA